MGRPVPGNRLHVIRIDDGPLETFEPSLELPSGQVSEVGEVVVGGPTVTHGYHGRPESTKLAKLRDPATGEILHRMGDLGRIDEQGRLWFCGRKAHRVQVGATPMFTVPCEGIFNAHPEVRRTALVGIGREGVTVPVICVELEPGVKASEQGRIREELRGLGQAHGPTREIQTFLFHPSFPVDVRHNAKIFREKLAVWAAKVAP